MNSDDAILEIIEAGTSVLLDVRPLKEEGLSVVHDVRIKRLAHAIRDLRTALGYNDSNDEHSK